MRSFIFVLLAMLICVSAFSSQLDKYVKNRFIDPETGKEIVEIVVPDVPLEQRIPGPIAVPDRAAIVLSNVPAFDWSFGCSATSASMAAGYYDNNGYPNMYIGPTNSGVMPLSNAGWGNWTDPASASRDQCPLSATRNGLDGRTTTGHVDRFWYGVNHSGDDPFGTGDPTSTYELCTADYMGTNQDWWNNIDGATTFYYYNDGSVLENYSGAEGNLGTARKRDGARGFRLFLESRGYTVARNYNQYINGYDPPQYWNGSQWVDPPVITGGYTYTNYKAEIDAGRPVLIQVTGHTMLGVGYDNASTTIYIHDTWDHTSHTMTWGGSYSGRTHYGVGVFQIENGPTRIVSPADNATSVSYDVVLSWLKPISNTVPTGYKVYFGTSQNPTEPINVGNVLSWTPNPHVAWNTHYYWKVVGYDASEANMIFSEERDFTVSNGDTGSGSSSGTGTVNIDVTPLNVSDFAVDPDVTVSSSSSVNVSIVVDNTALHAGTLPNPTNVSLSYRMSITGSGDMSFTLGFDGLDALRLQPDEVACYDNNSWSLISSPVWNYTNETVTFSKNIASGRAEIEFVLNNGDSTLPVELSSFTAIPTSDNQVQVNWTTQSEVNVMGYNIYRGTDFQQGEAQLLTTELISAHNQPVEYHYSYTDAQTSQVPVYYYWLESIDYDQTNEFFGPVVVNFASYYFDMTESEVMIEDHRMVNLQWTTANESSILVGFDVYRSPVRNFTSAEKINVETISSVNSQFEHTYNFSDSDIEIGEDYFYWIAGLSWDNILTISDPIEIYLPNLDLTSFSADITND